MATALSPSQPRAVGPGGRRQATNGRKLAHETLAPAVVSQRLCDLLLSFPSAAIGGVQWKTLVRRYEVKHGSRLHVSSLRASSPQILAMTLLWEVFRLENTEDTDNPVVAVEDAVVLVPRPGFMGTWPSLYKTLCDIVLNHGTPEYEGSGGGSSSSSSSAAPPPTGEASVVAHGLLLSKLNKLLQDQWHANFDEYVGYLTDEGNCVRMKKPKHLVQAVLRWRNERIMWRRMSGGKASAVDEAIEQKLDLQMADKYNDLILRLIHKPCVELESAELQSLQDSRRSSTAGDRHRKGSLGLPMPPRSPEVFDDPFEPPPELVMPGFDGWAPLSKGRGRGDAGSTTASSPTAASLAWTLGDMPGSWCSGSATPMSHSMSMGSSYEAMQSGACTPSMHSAGATPHRGPALAAVTATMTYGFNAAQAAVPSGHMTAAAGSAYASLMPVGLPVWVGNFMPSRLLGDREVIPNGIVQQARAFFEPPHPVQDPSL